MVSQDPITQAILSESVMEPQAPNEVDEEEEEGTVNSQSEESEKELVTLSQVGMHGFLPQQKENNSDLMKLWTDTQQKKNSDTVTDIPFRNSIICPSIRRTKSCSKCYQCCQENPHHASI